MTEDHVHSWQAAVLFDLTDSEAALVAAYPDFIEGAAAAAPRQTVGPWCSECLVHMSDLSVERAPLPSR